MEKVRTLTWEGLEYEVSNTRGILGPGKFNGLALHAVRDYDSIFHDDFFGDSSEWVAYYWQAGHRYYRECDQGFVYEISFEHYKTDEEAWFLDSARKEEQETALAEVEDALAEAMQEETGPCDSCQACMINGVRCHETGCRRQVLLLTLKRQLDSLNDY